MTEFTPDRLAELKAVAEAATEPDHYVCDCYVQCGDEVCPNPKPIYRSIDNEAVLRLVAALEAKTYEAERLREMGQGLIKQRDEARAEVEALDREVWRMRALRTEASADRTLEMVEQQRDEARAEVERLGDVEKMLAESEHANETYAGIEGELMDLKQTLTELAPSAAIVLTEEVVVDGDVFTWGDLPDVLSRTREHLAEAQREVKDQYIKRRDAEAAIERVREAATEVANQGDNNGATHYEKCWTQHLHCLAAKIIHETGAEQ